ncbi:hypothetical protein J4226_05060 [Candidatus Pacearchaeota archaeon]|nr:hypothetical protein [Candidatus Pacearchaeota archaeon]
MTGEKILYIEDNRDTASAVKIILEGEGYEVTLAYNGRKFAFLSAIPVSKERVGELKKVGVSDYITKPFVKADLIKRVGKILKA